MELDHLFGPETKTDADGRFVLEHVPRTALRIRAIANGYLPESTVADPARSGVPLRIVLRRGGLVRITVLTASGGPGVAYTVHVDASRTSAEPNYEWTQTDDAGQCQARLTPGTYRIAVLRDPDSEEILAQDDVTLVEGAEAEIEIRLP